MAVKIRRDRKRVYVICLATWDLIRVYRANPGIDYRIKHDALAYGWEI